MSESLTSYTSVDVQHIWQQACTSLQQQVSPAVFNTWILSNPLTSLETLEPGKIKATISSPTAFHATTVKKNVADYLLHTLTALLEQEVILDFVVRDPAQTATSIPTQPVTNQSPAIQRTTLPATPVAAPAPGLTANPSLSPLTPAQTTSTAELMHTSLAALTRSSRHQASPSPRVEQLFSDTTIRSVSYDRAVVMARQIGLRPDYTFETFAVSGTNEMAHAAATAVSNKPGTAYNPLFLYGGVGVGKTHLMHAIGNNILKNNPDTKIFYCTGEEFTNDIVSAIQNKKALKFKEKYRSVQVLLIDDIQFIAGKNAVQEEFFHTFNALLKNAFQIVLTSDRPPHEINLLEDRLRSRFEAGLMIDIQQPTFELRTAILLIKASAHNLLIPMDIAQLIASKVDSARKIEGIVTSIKSEVELKHREINVELVEEILKTEISLKKKTLKVHPNDVLRAVANHYHLKQAAIKGQRRTQELVNARHVAMFLLKEELHMSFVEIGRWFSNRDHTSAMHAYRKVEQGLTQDELLQRDISALRMSLTAISK